MNLPLPIKIATRFAALLAVCWTGFACSQTDTQTDTEIKTKTVEGFDGKIAKSYENSVEVWPEEQTFTGDEPNVLIILLDDVGYGQLGAYGGLTETPNMDRLAAEGLIYTDFHTTALCSPSRAAILAGRNHHSIGLGSHANTAMGFPGYAGRVPLSAQAISRNAQIAGWSTYAIGKWDHTPGFQVHQVGPFTYWPTHDGFDHTYTFMAADVSNFAPVMYAGHEPVEPARDNPDYHLSTDLADKAIYYLTGKASIDPDRPFFMFWAPGAAHTPHHAPDEYLQKYRGKFDMGWDKAREMTFARQIENGVIPEGTVLTERPDDIPAWNSLSDEEKKMYAREMEAFAAQLDHVDMEIGRMVETLERIGELDNTLIIITSDNGASAEGGLAGTHNEVLFVNGQQASFESNQRFYDEWGTAETFNHYHAGWAWAGNTPFKYFKQIVHRGGVQDPMIVHWPSGIEAKGEVRSQYHHIIDIGPTVLEALGLDPLEEIDGIKQLPFDGTSFAYTFNDKDAADRHTRQYYELLGNRAMYMDGWKAVTIHANRMPWSTGGTFPFEDDVWELYNLNEDFSESNNVVDQYPEKLKELQEAWDEDAWKYNVYPLYDNIAARIGETNSHYAPQREEFVFYPPGATRISEQYSPPVKNRNHTITAYAKIPDGGAEGVLVAAGGLYGGYAFYVHNNRLVYAYNAFNEDRYFVRSNVPVPSGEVELKAEYEVAEGLSGMVTLYINGNKVGQGEIGRIHAVMYSLSETFDVGEDTGTLVSKEYNRENEFSGTLDKLVVRIPKAN
ncbi:arylsulfatase [uncultured Draconibacterium sp.]|uniref:arylsulfatase n=1 Tax=uncultured Draconibacterium sp. TaxID=1573823 RepID=UPI0032180332